MKRNTAFILQCQLYGLPLNFYVVSWLTWPQLIDDANISCPLPELPSEPPYLANLNLLTAFCQIQSRAYSRLFAVTAHKNPQEQIYTEIDSLHNDLEAWRQSVPEEYRPGLPLRMRQLPKSSFILMALQHHLSYYLLLVAIARLDIYLSCGSGSVRSTKSKKVLMEAARSIVEVVQLAPLEPSTPMKYESHYITHHYKRSY